MSNDTGKSLTRKFLDFLNEKGGRKNTRHDELLRWDKDIRAVVQRGSSSLTKSELSEIHRKSALLWMTTTLAEKLNAEGCLDRETCAWMSTALEGTDQQTLRCGLLEVQVAGKLCKEARADFQVVDFPGRPEGGKRTDFSLAQRASIECKRLVGNPRALTKRLKYADKQHEEMRATILDADAMCVTIVSLAQGDSPEEIEPKLLDKLKKAATTTLAKLSSTDAVVLVVESWRDMGSCFRAEMEALCALKPGRIPEDSLPKELSSWCKMGFLTLDKEEVVGMLPG